MLGRIVLALGPTIGPTLPAEVWNALFSWFPGASRAAGPTPAPLIGVGVYLAVALFLVFAVFRLVGSSGSAGEEEVLEVDLSGMLDAERQAGGADEATGSAVGEEVGRGEVEAGAGQTVRDLADEHQHLLSAPEVELHSREPTVDGRFAKTMAISTFPDYPEDAFLRRLWSLTDAEYDVTAYMEPTDHRRTREEMTDIADDLKAEANVEASSRNSYLVREAERAEATAEAVEGGTRVYKLAMYVTVWGDTKDELHENERKVRRELSREPANMVPKVWPGKADKALPSSSPLGEDRMAYHDPERFKNYALSGAIGALLGSFRSITHMEESGFEHGLHKETELPVYIDPFERENGFAKFGVGDPGSGKSHSNKAHFIRAMRDLNNIQGVVLEPLGNWRGVSRACGAEVVTIGGDKGLNPMEVREMPAHARRSLPNGATPLDNKIAEVMAFIENFLALRGLSDGYSERQTTLEKVVTEVYNQRGFTNDPATFTNESPTIQDDVLPLLEECYEKPEEYVSHESRAEGLKEDSQWFLKQLEPFRDGNRFDFLGRQTEIDMFGESVTYLDLGQQEGGQVADEAVLTMQMLISQVYEMAKQSQERTIFVMDEFRYILESADNLAFMETLFRHHRHHEISPWILTQTVSEFFEHSEAEFILDMCSIKQFHRLEDMDDELAEKFRMNGAQMRFVQQAEPGNPDLGYGDALIGIDGEYRKVEIHTLPQEFEVIEYDDTEQVPSELPGIDIEGQEAPPAAADGGAGGN